MTWVMSVIRRGLSVAKVTSYIERMTRRWGRKYVEAAEAVRRYGIPERLKSIAERINYCRMEKSWSGESDASQRGTESDDASHLPMLLQNTQEMEGITTRKRILLVKTSKCACKARKLVALRKRTRGKLDMRYALGLGGERTWEEEHRLIVTNVLRHSGAQTGTCPQCIKELLRKRSIRDTVKWVMDALLRERFTIPTERRMSII